MGNSLLISGMLLGQALKEAKYGGIVGTDYSGIVEELGPDVPDGERAVGEHVAGVGGPIFGRQFPSAYVFAGYSR
jgi:NADPH:quinone reductase-like Zn-dependent oxidoreductase